jgi:hypothetical protein
MTVDLVLYYVELYFLPIYLVILAFSWPGIKMPNFFKILDYLAIVFLSGYFFVRPLDPSTFGLYVFLQDSSLMRNIEFIYAVNPGSWREGFFDGFLICLIGVIGLNYSVALYKHFKKIG